MGIAKKPTIARDRAIFQIVFIFDFHIRMIRMTRTANIAMGGSRRKLKKRTKIIVRVLLIILFFFGSVGENPKKRFIFSQIAFALEGLMGGASSAG
ncbi:MAG TPA: hypothetical protein P5075_08225 [Eubacteriales bacterium]|nr:hypothetical protein [Eubacteriales bacterium]